MEDLSLNALHLLGQYWTDRTKGHHPAETSPIWGKAQRELESKGLIETVDCETTPMPTTAARWMWYGERWVLTKAGIAFCTLVNPRRIL